MNKKSLKNEILFWVIISIISIFITAITLFYFDLANGPLVCFILELLVIGGALTGRILLRHKRFWLRALPTIAFVLATAIIVSVNNPVIAVKSAVDYRNPVKTEVLHLANGDVRGVYNKDKTVEVYAGIPYAKPPVGELRWKEPQDVENWDGVRECDKFAPKSMQPASNSITSALADIYAAKAWHPDYIMHPEQNMSEDSLYLNIWRPNNDEKDLPILVFIHGGSLTTGSSAYEDYNGEEMAKKGVIMITITYRLGVFGYFAHEDLAKESTNGTTGNYGLLDQIKALEWVNKNAEYFGGDKNNVTIAGESAGSSSVSALCSTPLLKGKGYFKRAIGESSSIVLKRAPHTYRKMKDALATGNKIMDEFKCKSIEDLRKIPAKKLVNTKFSNSSMTLDGYALDKDPYDVYLAHENNEEALLNGYNVLEADAFVIPTYLTSPTNKKNIKGRLIKEFGDIIGNKFYELYKDKIEKDAFSAFNEIYSVYWFIAPHHYWSNLALNNGVKVYRYQFTKENHFHGTYHAGEMIYAYGNVKNCPEKWRYDSGDIKLSNTMLTYWSNFAKTGNPNCTCAPNWEEYTGSGDGVMELGQNVGKIEDKYLKAYDLIDEYMDKMIASENA